MSDLSPSELHTDVHAALTAWNRLRDASESRLLQLVLVQERLAQSEPDAPGAARLAINQVLRSCLDALAAQDQESANILTWRFQDGDKIRKVAHRLNLGPDQVKRRQRQAIAALTRLLIQRETAARDRQAAFFNAQLKAPTYRRLLGVDEQRQRLVEMLLSPEPPWVIALTGIGGIGKTALANAAVRDVIGYFQYRQIVWITVSRPADEIMSPITITEETLMRRLAARLLPYMPADTPAAERNWQIRNALKRAPVLVVIDNLESALTAPLLHTLHDLAQPSRFLLTSRVRPLSQGGVRAVELSELDDDHALQLIRGQAEAIGAESLLDLPEPALRSIVDRVGGNPLALKLVVGLCFDLPVSHVLDELLKVQVDEVASMYRHVYWHIWHSLQEVSRTLLLAMQLGGSEGMALEQMQAASELDEKDVRNAVRELSRRSLLEVRGPVESRRYAIHRLTETFVQSEIIAWPASKL